MSHFYTFRFRFCLFVCILIVAAIVSPSPAQAAKETPNIVFILTDDQRLEDIQHMPTLKRLLVGQGMIFDNYFSNVSLCCPSRTSILRGQFAHNTGVMTNGGQNGGFDTAHRLGREDSTIATWLHDSGYRTALIGKYLNHYPGDMGPTYVPPGWDYWASAVAGNAYGEYNYTLNENGKNVHYGNSAEDYGTDVYAHKAVEFIKGSAKDKKPFFLYLAFYAPHGPATPAPRHEGMFADAKIVRSPAFNEADVSTKPAFIQRLSPMTGDDIQSADAYYQKRLCSLQAVDEAIGNLYQTLSETKQLDNTYIVFAADNGFHLGEHRLLRGKQTAYETDIHLPLIVRGPGVKGGASSEELVGNIDLAPTFADLAGATAPDFVDGRSIAPILKGANLKGLKWRDTFLVEHVPGGGGKGKGKGNKRKLSETRCDRCELCASHCNHAVPCYCGGSHIVNAVADSDAAGAACRSPGDEVQLAAYGEQEVAEIAEMAEADGPEDSLQMTEVTPAPQTKRGRRKHHGRGGAAGMAKEMGRIPEHQALREAHSLYVEYATGEREYYQLSGDANEVNNLIGKQEGKDLEAKSVRLHALKNSAAKSAREIDSTKQ